MTLILSGSDGVSDIDGSASTPAVRGSDANTGIFFPAADTIAFAEGGTEAMRIDSSGNVGIGTSSPVAYGTRRTLAIDGTGGVVVDLFVAGTRTGTIVAETNDLQIGTIANGPTRFLTNGSERARIDSSGNLQFDSGYGSVATAYGCRAWVNFDGTGTPAIRASGNVSSITDNGTGLFTVNITNALPDTNYAWVGTSEAASNGGGLIICKVYGTALTTSAIALQSKSVGNAGVDAREIYVAIFR